MSTIFFSKGTEREKQEHNMFSLFLSLSATLKSWYWLPVHYHSIF